MGAVAGARRPAQSEDPILFGTRTRIAPVAEQVRALALEKCKFANVVVLNDRKLVAQLDCPDPADGDRAILNKIATVQGVVQTNVISVIRPVRP